MSLSSAHSKLNEKFKIRYRLELISLIISVTELDLNFLNSVQLCLEVGNSNLNEGNNETSKANLHILPVGH